MSDPRKLYDVLVREGKYSKSFGAFLTQFQDEDYQEKVHGVVTRDNLYTKGIDEFKQQYKSSGSELGSVFSSYTPGYQVGLGPTRSFGAKSSIRPDLYSEKKLQAAKHEDPEWQEQSKDFENKLEEAFGNKPTLFGEIIENAQNLTLEEREKAAGIFGSPEEYLLNIVKNHVGGMGWWDGPRNVDESTGLPVYHKLSDSDIETIIETKFYDKLAVEKINKSNDFALSAKSNIEKQKINIRTWQDDNRKRL